MEQGLNISPLDADNIRAKINEKVNQLFMRLKNLNENDDEKPCSSKIEKREDDDDLRTNCPPIEAVMCVPGVLRREHFFKCVSVGDVLIGKCVSNNDQGHVLNAICYYSRQRFIDDLGIRLLCPRSGASLGDILKVVVVDIVREEEKVIVCDKGVVSDDDWGDVKDFSNRPSKECVNLIHTSPAFVNPTCVQQLCDCLSLPTHASLTCPTDFSQSHMGKTLRQTQSARWADKHLIQGVEYLKNSDYASAQQSLNLALQIHPNNIEALVARGALYANKESYIKALEDFDRALELDQNHPNARKYMSETLVAIGRKQQEKGDYENAIKTFKRAIAFNVSNSEAKNELSNIESGQMSSRSNKSNEKRVRKEERTFEKESNEKKDNNLSHTKDKIKLLLKQESKTKKKKRKKHISSSDESSSSSSQSSETSTSSSSDSSTSDSSDSSRESKRKRKKKRRSKKRKSKKNKKDSKKSLKETIKSKKDVKWVEHDKVKPVLFSIKKKEESKSLPTFPLTHFVSLESSPLIKSEVRKTPEKNHDKDKNKNRPSFRTFQRNNYQDQRHFNKFSSQKQLPDNSKTMTRSKSPQFYRKYFERDNRHGSKRWKNDKFHEINE